MFQLQLCSIRNRILKVDKRTKLSSCCPRFWRRKVHLIWGSPMASAMLHLLPVLGLTGGRRVFPYRRQDLVPWMQQQPLHTIEKLLTMYLFVHVLTLALTKLLKFITKFKNPSWLLGKTQLNRYHHWKMILWGISLLLSDIHTGTTVMYKDEVSKIMAQKNKNNLILLCYACRWTKRI